MCVINDLYKQFYIAQEYCIKLPMRIIVTLVDSVLELVWSGVLACVVFNLVRSLLNHAIDDCFELTEEFQLFRTIF